MNYFVVGGIVAILIILIFLLINVGVFDYGKSESFVIDLPETDWYNFNCNSPNVLFRTKDALETFTKKEILNHGGKQEDINLMDLQIENISASHGNSCNVSYSFKTPEHGEWSSSVAPRINKVKNVLYQTVQFDTSHPLYGGYNYEYPWYRRPWMGWRWNTPHLYSRPYYGWGGRRWGWRRRY